MRVATNQILLDDDAAPDGFDRTVENRDKTVAGGFDEPSVMFCDAGLNEIALDPLDAAVRSFFIQFHQTAVARDVAGHDRCKATGRCSLGGSPGFPDLKSRFRPWLGCVSTAANGV